MAIIGFGLLGEADMPINVSLVQKFIGAIVNPLGKKGTEKSNSVIKKDQETFLLTVFEETNEHLRATDEKSILVGGYFIGLASIVGGILLDKVFVINWATCIFSFAILTIGYFLILLQLWYRKWKEHYLHICKTIASCYQVDDKFLPCWLHNPPTSLNNRFCADKLVFVVSISIELATLSYCIYLVLNLLSQEKVSIFLDSIIVAVIMMICLLSVFMGKFLLKTMEA